MSYEYEICFVIFSYDPFKNIHSILRDLEVNTLICHICDERIVRTLLMRLRCLSRSDAVLQLSAGLGRHPESSQPRRTTNMVIGAREMATFYHQPKWRNPTKDTKQHHLLNNSSKRRRMQKNEEMELTETAQNCVFLCNRNGLILSLLPFRHEYKLS